MNPIISVSVYVLALLLAIWLTMTNLRALFGAGKAVGKAVTAAAVAAIALFGVTPLFGAFMRDGPVKFFLQGVGNIFLGFFIYYMMFLLIISLVLVLVRLIAGREPGKLRAVLYVCTLGAAAVLFFYGLRHAQQTIITRYDVEIDKSAGGLRDMKLVLIGDLHMSVNSHPETMERMVELINAEAPDAVLIAGDILTSSYAALGDPARYAGILKGIRAEEGVYAVYGNHDVEETLLGGFPVSPISEAFRTEEIERFFADCGFTVLLDEICTIGGGAVQIAGRVDGEKAGDGTAERMSAAELLAGADTRKPVIVLEHEPVDFANLKAAGADLALCGHTHAGQIFPGNLVVPFFNENAYGRRTVDGLDTIVTSGIGYYGPPMRVGTNSEIVVIQVHFA